MSSKATKEGSSQTDFPTDLEQELLGQYLEAKLEPTINELKVILASRDNHSSEPQTMVTTEQVKHDYSPAPEIVIVEYEEDEII